MAESELSGLSAFMRGRTALYKFFSVIFKEPLRKDELIFINSHIEYFKAMAEESVDVCLKNGSELFSAASGALSKALNVDEKQIISELNIAYTSLFLLGPHSINYTESSFFSKAGLWKQKEWEDVKECYRLNCFVVQESFKEPEDHIAMELSFMAALSDLTATSIDEGDDDACTKCIETQKDFLKRHLLNWVPDFCDKIIERPATNDAGRLYHASALLLKGYLTSDAAMLEELT